MLFRSLKTGFASYLSAYAYLDLNGDRIPDILARGDDGLTVILGKPGLQFAPPVHYPVAQDFFLDDFFDSNTLVDMDGDGNPDFISAGPNGVYITYGRADGSFASANVYESGTVDFFATVADFNEDKNPDVVTTGTTQLQLNFGKADGTFTQKTTLTTTGSGPSYTVIADLDGDGTLDIATADVDGGAISFFLGNNDGTFMSLSDVSIPGKPVSLTVADFNRDGIADLAASNEDGTVTILFGTENTSYPYLGSAAFYVAPPLNPGGYGPIVSGDFNGDGIPDLAVPGVNGIAIYLSKGDGTFSLASPLAASNVQGLEVADFNGDGISDLLVTELIDNQPSVIIFTGAGDGTFPHSSAPTATLFAASSVVADFNGDGIPDFAASNLTNNAVGVLLGNQTTTSSISGITLTTAGTHIITPSFSGTNSLAPSVGPPLTIDIPAQSPASLAPVSIH